MLVWAPLANAQEAQPDPSQVDAREAFRLGSEAAAEERWADSERWFRQAYELSQVASALFNQAVALRALGRHREARDAFASLLEGDVDAAVRASAEQLMRQSANRVATIQLDGLDDDADHSVQLDGAPQADEGQRPLTIEADEGSHSILVVRPGYEPFTWSGTAAAGSTVHVEVALEAVPEQTVVVRETVREGVSVFEEPVFWIVVGLVAAAGGAAIGIGVAYDQAQLQPDFGMVFEL